MLLLKSRFKPTKVSGLELWLKADSLQLNNADPVGTWADSSGNGRDATQGTAAAKPTFRTGVLNGKPVVRFDSVDDFIACSASANYRHFFVVAKYNLATFPVSAFDGLVSGVDAISDNIVLTGDDSLTVFFDESTLTTAYHKNGSSFTEGNMQAPMEAFAIISISKATNWAITVQLGKDRANANRFWDGDVAEVIGYSSALSEADRKRVERYLSKTYAIALS